MRYPLLLAALVLAGACKETTKPPPPDPMIGDYPMRSIDGNPPPQIVAEDTVGRLSILAGMVRLKANNAFVDSTDVQFVSSTGQVATSVEVARGTWLTSHDTLFLSPVGSPSYYMVVTVSGIELTQDFDGIRLVYRR